MTNSFDQQVWILLEDLPVLEGARLGFVAVHAKILRLRGLFGHERPFESGRKASSSTSTQIRLLHLIGDLFRLHCKRLLQRFVATVREINVDRVKIGDVGKDDLIPVGHVFFCRVTCHFKSARILIYFVDRQVFVVLLTDREHRGTSARSHAFNLGESPFLVFGSLAHLDAELLFQVVHDPVGTPQHAGNIRADFDVVFAALFPVKHRIERNDTKNVSERHIQTAWQRISSFLRK